MMDTALAVTTQTCSLGHLRSFEVHDAPAGWTRTAELLAAARAIQLEPDMNVTSVLRKVACIFDGQYCR